MNNLYMKEVKMEKAYLSLRVIAMWILHFNGMARNNFFTVQKNRSKRKNMSTVQRTEVKENKMNSGFVMCDHEHISLSKGDNYFYLFILVLRIVAWSDDCLQMMIISYLKP